MAGAFSEFPFSTDSSGIALPVLLSLLGATNRFFPLTFALAPAALPSTGGGLTNDDFLDLWKSVTDPGYHSPILEKPDGGAEFILAALSIARGTASAVDASTQSLYILPFSGQTSDPAHTARLATGFLQFSRTPTAIFPAWIPVVFKPAEFAVDHLAIDWSETGPLEVDTGRRYFLTQLASLGPGDLGPHLYPARAEKPGASYNVPGPGTIRLPVQAGAGLNNIALSTSAPTPSANWLVLAPAPDLLSGAQVGLYVLLTAPAGVAGQVRRLSAVLPPTDSTSAGTAVLDTVGVFATSSIAGAFVLGEDVAQASTGAHGNLVAASNGTLALEQTSGSPFTVGAVLGATSGATATISQVIRDCALPIATSVAWVVLDWELDVGLSVTNLANFSGGRLPVLEELGLERGVPRAISEPEETYRRRVATADDVVSPNALLRSANRTLAQYGGAGCLREVGSSKLPGLFYDVPPDGNPAHAFAFDMDPVVRPGDRWKVLLDLTDFRAFFLMGVPAFELGYFGLYFDTDPGADSPDVYFDGYATTDVSLWASVYSNLLRAKAGGVGFELYVESGGCA